ncbi:MAG: hypothetical protein LH477_00515 [Nocardioides sp.]|nr:hypothetical protein [Nocardioides sp.]
MTSRTVHIAVERVVVTGASVADLDPARLRLLVRDAVVAGLGDSALPAGRAVHASIQVDAPALGTTNASVSRAVGSGIVRAASGTSSGTVHHG